MADEKLGTFNLQSFIQHDMPGAKFMGPGSQPGTIKLIVPQGVKDPATGAYRPDVEVNLHKMFEADGIDPSQVDIKYNDEKTAVEDSPMGFVDRMKYEYAHRPADKARFLAQKFGAENLRFDPETESMKVFNKQDGVWYDASKTGLAGFIGESGDVTAGAIAGGTAGSAIGTAILPGVGTAVGGVLGAGIGAVVARFSGMKAAEAAGLRTEQDAAETAKELAIEGILATAGEATGPALKYAGKAGMNLLNRAIGKTAANFSSDTARLAYAEWLQAASKLPVEDGMQWMERREQVAAHQATAIDWLKKTKGQGYNPVQKEMAEIVQDAVSAVRKDMDNKFVAEDTINRHLLKDVEVDMLPVQQRVNEMLAGIAAEIPDTADDKSIRQLKKTVAFVKKALRDETRTDVLSNRMNAEALGKRAASMEDLAANGPLKDQMIAVNKELDSVSATKESAKNAVGYIPTKEARALRDATEQMKLEKLGQIGDMNEDMKLRALREANNLRIAERQAELKGLDPRALEQRGMGGDAAARDLFWSDMKADIRVRKTLSQEEARKVISGLDDILEAAGQYNLGPREITTKARARILNLRGQIHDQMIAAIEKKDPQLATRYRMMNDAYSTQREWIDDVAKGTRDEYVDSTVQKLLKGGKPLDNMVSALERAGKDPQAFKNELFDRKAGLSSMKFFKDPSPGVALATAFTGAGLLMSPRYGPRITSKSFNVLQMTAKRNEFVTSLSPAERRALLNHPFGLRALEQITAQGIDDANQGGDALVNQALQQSMPSPTPMPPPAEPAKKAR